MSLKHEEIVNPDSCLNRAADDEPIFVLRANDPVAAAVVRFWASAYISDKFDSSIALSTKQHAKVQEARGLANQMDGWRREQQRIASRAEGDRRAQSPDARGLIQEPTFDEYRPNPLMPFDCEACGYHHAGPCPQ